MRDPGDRRGGGRRAGAGRPRLRVDQRAPLLHRPAGPARDRQRAAEGRGAASSAPTTPAASRCSSTPAGGARRTSSCSSSAAGAARSSRSGTTRPGWAERRAVDIAARWSASSGWDPTSWRASAWGDTPTCGPERRVAGREVPHRATPSRTPTAHVPPAYVWACWSPRHTPVPERAGRTVRRRVGGRRPVGARPGPIAPSSRRRPPAPCRSRTTTRPRRGTARSWRSRSAHPAARWAGTSRWCRTRAAGRRASRRARS